ncbi:MAG TPA: hypothetical protein VGL22_13315 [Terracidiphilus sp.]|jgi:hypothetical protein
MNVDYKGCFLQAIPNELADGSGWTVELYVARPDGEAILDTQYLFERKFPSERSAVDAAIEAGKRLIDGTITPTNA